MDGRTALAGLMVLWIGGCGAPRTPELDYLPPSGEPAAARSALVQQQPWLIWGNIIDHLQQQGLELTEIDEPADELVATYSGDPEPYVDCGWIVAYGRDEVDRLPAATSEASFLRRRDGRAVTVDRDLWLDATLSVQLEPENEHTVVRVDSTYVLTKSIAAQDGQPPLHAETISFGTGEAAAFSAGTTCQPNGNLERTVFDALPPVSLAGS